MVEDRLEDVELIVDEEPKLEDPIFIEGLTGVGHVGRTAVGYLVDHLEAEQFASLYSHHFPHWTFVNEDQEIDLIKNKFYHVKREEGQRDLIFLLGNAQSIDPLGHYRNTHRIIKFLNDRDVSDIITIGGYGKGEMVEDPSVLGVVSDSELKDDYEQYDIEFDHSVGKIVGASGLLLGMGKRYGLRGLCLLGETPGFLLSDPKATEEVLKVMEGVLDLDIDYSNLEDKIKEAEKVLKKIQELQKEVKSSSDQEDKLGYIG